LQEYIEIIRKCLANKDSRGKNLFLHPSMSSFLKFSKYIFSSLNFFCQTIQLDIYLRNTRKKFCFKIPYILGDTKDKFLTNNTYFWFYKLLDLFLFYSPEKNEFFCRKFAYVHTDHVYVFSKKIFFMKIRYSSLSKNILAPVVP
jgi:hypothetical protein